MKVIVLGSGVIGVSSAYYLARAGHEVTVVDRQAEPAQETSFANAGEVSPGYASPWAGPGVPVKAIKWLLMHHRPLVIRPQFDLNFVRWGLAMLRNCTAHRYELNKGRMVRLAEYSRDCLKTLRAETGIRYDERMQGTLQLFRTQKQLDGIGGDVKFQPACANCAPIAVSSSRMIVVTRAGLARMSRRSTICAITDTAIVIATASARATAGCEAPRCGRGLTPRECSYSLKKPKNEASVMR